MGGCKVNASVTSRYGLRLPDPASYWLVCSILVTDSSGIVEKIAVILKKRSLFDAFVHKDQNAQISKQSVKCIFSLFPNKIF
jgi:hypothetical protein